jgi:hypothetical protein
MWESFREVLADVFMIFSGGWIALHLVIIAIYGTVCITERFPWILYPEVIMVVALIALGIERLTDDIKVLKR